MEKPPNFEVIVGTYEEFLLGYKIQINQENCEFKQSFATHEHSSSLRCVTTEGKFLASGGADDRICVYDMIARKEHITLTHHNSTINCLQFTDKNTHLISSSADGTLAVTRVGNWVLEKIWTKAHKHGYPVAMAVHPTGKLLFTLGSDCTLNTWNLIKGRVAYILNLNSKCTDAKSLSFIKMNPTGENFILGGGMNIQIWNIESGGITTSFSYKVKVTCAAWLSDDTIAIGHENGTLRTLNIETKDENEYNAYENRIKCMEFQDNYLVTASSLGIIKLWSVGENELNELVQCKTGCRITCITLVDALKVKKEETNEETTVKETENIEPKKIQVQSKQKIIIEEDSDEETLNTNETKIISQNKNKKKKRANKVTTEKLDSNVHPNLKNKNNKRKLDVQTEKLNVTNESKSKSKRKKSKISKNNDWNVESVE